MKLHYHKEPHGNFGDDLNAWLWEELTPGIWNDSGDTMVSGIGTILNERMPAARRWIVMSSGTGYDPAPDAFRIANWNVLCVRGPLTAKVLGLAPEKAATDGAILLSLLPQYQPTEESERHGVVFMPHHSKTLKLGRWKEACEQVGIEFLDPRLDSKYLLQRIRHARLVLAHALHAAIVADSVRVPWLPLLISSETNSFKWLDWTLSMELPYKPVSLRAGALLEDIYSWTISVLRLRHTFSDLSANGAIRHHYGFFGNNKKGFSTELKKLIVNVSFGVFRHITQLPLIGNIYRRLDRKRFNRAVVSLRAALQEQSFLSRAEVFAKKKNEMKGHLETLRDHSSAC
jgi:succinoglycan biosynthesis protein ExoV